MSKKQKFVIDTILSLLALSIGSDRIIHDLSFPAIGGINLEILPSELNENFYFFHITKQGEINQALISENRIDYKPLSRGFYKL